jgi:hypothetical protein
MPWSFRVLSRARFGVVVMNRESRMWCWVFWIVVGALGAVCGVAITAYFVIDYLAKNF